MTVARRLPNRAPALVGACTFAVLTAALASSCSMFSAVQENIELVNDVQAGLVQAEKTQPGVKFVVKENTWFCATREAALSGTACPGGALLEINELVDTVGSDTEGDAWRVLYLENGDPEGDGWVQAEALDVFPVLDRYRESRKAFQQEFSAEVRMTPADRNTDAFTKPSDALRQKVWLDSVRREFLYDLTYASDGLSFWLPVEGAGRGGVEVFFYLRSPRYAQRMRRHRYACTEIYCDEMSFVARLIDYKLKPGDRPGPAEGFPVMEIIRFADRFDEYRVRERDEAAPGQAAAVRSRASSGPNGVDGGAPSR